MATGRQLSVLAFTGFFLLLCGCAELASYGVINLKDDPKQAELSYEKGMAYTQGRGVKQDYSQGISKFKQAAYHGSSNGAYMVGMSYLTGRGVKQDDAVAARWLEQAAQAGHTRAEYQLSVLYMNGYGVVQDREWAMFLACRAAEGGHEQAAFDVAVAYATGSGLPKDRSAAWYWFVQAEKVGIEHARTLRRKMVQLTSSTQRSRAGQMIQKLKNQSPDKPAAQYIQQQLRRLDYLKGPVDGIWGRQSSAAFSRYTEQELLLSDVTIDWEIIQLLRQDK